MGNLHPKKAIVAIGRGGATAVIHHPSSVAGPPGPAIFFWRPPGQTLTPNNNDDVHRRTPFEMTRDAVQGGLAVAAAKKKKSLVIVESPAKAKTINKYLGPDFEVVASKERVWDLPKSRFGIDIEKDWTPTYRVLNDRKDLIADLKKRAAGADIVYLAPDPDREGEAIAWHLKESLGLKDAKTQRVTFNEITKSAIKNAFDHAGAINMDRVGAQEARRFLDRVVGYRLSPLLSQKLAQHLSA